MWEYRPGSPLVFNHIPKTAGTALSEALIERLRPAHVCQGIDLSMFGTFDDFDSIRPAVRRGIVFEPSDLPLDAVLVSGHIAPSTTLARYPDALHFTVLREPRVRLLSLWLFNRAHTDFMLRRWGSVAVWFRAARRPLGSYLGEPFVAAHTDNAMTRLLLWPHPLIPAGEFIDPDHDDELVAAGLARLADFAHVGLVEDPELQARMGRWLGVELTMHKRNEVRSLPGARRPDLAAELTPEALANLEQRTRIDARLWEHVAATTMPDSDAAKLRADTYQRVLERYAGALARPVRPDRRRQLVEHLYDAVLAARSGGGRKP